MQLNDKDMLARLGRGESIAAVCQAAGIDRRQFDAWWRATIAARVPAQQGSWQTQVAGPVEIERDAWGIPHIYAQTDEDLFFGFGFAMAQDRLFQMDYLRRKGAGRLAEILGPAGLELDVLGRTVGLNRIAEAEWQALPGETRTLLEAFAGGVNAAMEQCREEPPIEFDLLAYRPEPWTPIDSLMIEAEFRWYLTGRFPILVMPELAKRVLGEGALYREFILGEADGETILPPEYYPPGKRPAEPVGHAANDPDGAVGSNNWVVDGRHTATGKPLIAGDPHIAIDAVSCWYEVHLCGGSFNVAGMAYVGMPGIMEGRNPRVAWAITNNLCSIRDLYQEQANPNNPDEFLYDGRWEPARSLIETIEVRGDAPVTKTIRFSRNGPIVDEVLPPPANKNNGVGPVSLKWLGAYQGGWLTALLQSNRAAGAAQFRESLRPWHVPTFCLVFADVEGNIGLQSTGRIPIRQQGERGYRPGWDPTHQWQGLIPFEDMPGVLNPERGWMATANNRLAGDDYPYLLHGVWANNHRGRRIRHMIEQGRHFTREAFQQMHYDIVSLRAVEFLPSLLKVLRDASATQSQATQHPAYATAVEALGAWDGQAAEHDVGPTLFNVFYTHWSQAVADARFDAPTAALLSKGTEGAASRLLAGDPHGWFAHDDRQARIVEAFRATLDLLTSRFGPEVPAWTWAKLHKLRLKHWLSPIGELGELLDYGGSVRGDYGTVCNTGSGPDWTATTGAGYRMVADLAADPPGIWAVDCQSQSGHPGSADYNNQHQPWLAGQYHFIPLEREVATEQTTRKLTLGPR